MVSAKTKAAAGWADYAILQASTGGREWKVQINADHVFRCNCPSFIFSGKGGAVRTCKHCKRCEKQWIEDGGTLGVGITPAGTIVPGGGFDPVRTAARAMFEAMVVAGRARQTTMVIGSVASTAMIDVLMTELKVFNPAMASGPVVAETVVVGVRRITFDD